MEKIDNADTTMASLILGTTFTSLWLLRSRPDQVHDECMRGDPPRAQFSKFDKTFLYSLRRYTVTKFVFLRI